MNPASSPDSPTASGPWTLITPTMSRFTLPTSTMRAMSRVSASVTRRPSRNSGTLPRRSISAPICGPPPCTTTGSMPIDSQQHDVLGEALEGLGLRRPARLPERPRRRRRRRRRGLAGRQGVAAVLDDDGPSREPPDVRQRVAQHSGLDGCGQLDLAHDRPMLSSTYAGVRSALIIVADPVPRPRSQVISNLRAASTLRERPVVVGHLDAAASRRSPAP